MERVYIEDRNFKNINYTEENLKKGDYEYCTFINCKFIKSDFSDINFVECTFENCDLSNAKVANTTFKGVRFKGCKLQGIRFDECNNFLLSIEMDACQANFSVFTKLPLMKMRFADSSFRESDFSGADLSDTTITNCDLFGAVFENTIFERTDLRLSYNYVIDPETNRLKKAKFSHDGILGLLQKYDIIVQ